MHIAHVIRSLLKKFFRQTPVPLMTYQLFDDFADILSM